MKEMNIPTQDVFELDLFLCVVVFPLGKYGRTEDDTFSQLYAQEQRPSDQSELTESEPKISKQLLTKRLWHRPSFRPKQMPYQSDVVQAVRDLCCICSSGTSVRTKDSLLREVLSPISSEDEESTWTGRPDQRDPEESTRTAMAARKQKYETSPFNEESNTKSHSDGSHKQAKKGNESTTAVTTKSVRSSGSVLGGLIGSKSVKTNMGPSGRSVRTNDSPLLEVRSPIFYREPRKTDRSAQRDPVESTKAAMAAKKQKYESRPFDKESNAKPRSDSRQKQANNDKESTAAVTTKSVLPSRSRLGELAGSKSVKKNMGPSGRSVRTNESPLLEVLSPISDKEPTETDRSAQRDPMGSRKAAMDAKKQKYETSPFDKESNAKPRSDSRHKQAKKDKESTAAVPMKSFLPSRSRLVEMIGARPMLKNE